MLVGSLNLLAPRCRGWTPHPGVDPAPWVVSSTPITHHPPALAVTMALSPPLPRPSGPERAP